MSLTLQYNDRIPINSYNICPYQRDNRSPVNRQRENDVRPDPAIPFRLYDKSYLLGNNSRLFRWWQSWGPPAFIVTTVIRYNHTLPSYIKCSFSTTGPGGYHTGH